MANKLRVLGVHPVRVRDDDTLETHVMEMDIDLSEAVASIVDALQRLTEASVDTGVADATSMVSRLDDLAKSWPVNAFENLIVEITKGTGVGQIRKIASNTATALVPVTGFDTAPDATSEYRIGFFGKMAGDITAWGGTAQTGADLTPLFQNLDIALSALRDALQGAGGKDFSTLETAVAAVEADVVALLAPLQARLSEATWTTRIGEVQASPTANTLLGRVKALEDLLADVATQTTLASILVESGIKLDESTWTARIGEVQATPTTNTVLARLKDIADVVGALQSASETLQSVIDGIAGSGGGAKTLADLTALVGEVQASPTQYSLLERLKVLDKADTVPLPLANLLVNPFLDVPDAAGTAPVGWTMPASFTWTRGEGAYRRTGNLKVTLVAGEELVHTDKIYVLASRNYVFGAMVKGGGLAGLKLNVFLFDSGDVFLEAQSVEFASALGSNWGWATRGFRSHASADYCLFSLKNEAGSGAPDTWISAPLLMPL